ncbi:hypothetical protein Chor_017273, partial [Crotalus horridus]
MPSLLPAARSVSNLTRQAATCVSTSSKIWNPFFNGSDIPLLAGSPCGDKNGYCDKFHIC